MKNVRSWAALCLAIALMLSAAQALANENPPAAGNRPFQIVVDSQAFAVPPAEPAPYINKDLRTMVPVSFVSQAMGVSASGIQWDSATKTATISHDGYTLTLTQGERFMTVNGRQVEMDTAAEIVNKRIFVPARYVAEGLGGSIKWDADARIVHILSKGSRTEQPTPAEAEAMIGSLGTEVLDALAARNGEALAALVHSELGLRFTPYTHVDLVNNLAFAAADLPAAFADSAVLHWGEYDGTGNPINLTFEGYLARFVQDHDYRTADQVSYNEQLFAGNIADNTAIVYPGSIVVEYHFPGFEAQYEGLDWRSLRLVFIEDAGEWKLAGIISDQWTT